MRMVKAIVLGLLLAAVASVGYAAPSGYSLGVDVKEFSLPNGMLFLLVERHATPQVACRIAIRAGSALEEAGKSGIAHLLEHMMFKGTKNFGTLDVKRDRELQEKIEAAYRVIREQELSRTPDRELIARNMEEMERLRQEVQKIYVAQALSSQMERNGAVGVNAFTSTDQTQYVMSVPSDMVEQWFSMMSEQLFEPSWREFYVEKEVVQREWAFRYINNPGGAAWLDLYSTAYSAHPYRNPVIGWKSDMERYSTRDAMDFHERYYTPANAVCVLVGDVTEARVRALAEIYFSRYPSGRRAPESVTAEPARQGPRRSVRYLKGARTPLVRIGFEGAPMGSDDFYALDALTMVLSHGRGARMTRNLVDEGLAVEAWAYNPDNRYGGMIVLGGSPREPDGAGAGEAGAGRAYLEACEHLEAVLLAEAGRLRTGEVSQRELDRVKKLNQRDFLDRLKSNEELAGTLATMEVQVGWRYLTTYQERISRVSPEDILRVAREYLDENARTTVFVIPGGTPDRPPEAYTEVRTSQGSSSEHGPAPRRFHNDSVYSTPAGWKHPLSFTREPTKIVYPEAGTETVRGARVFYLPDRDLPLVDLNIFVKGGAVDVPRDRLGLSTVLTGALIRGGTETYPPDELAMILDENAIRVSVSLHEEDSVVSLSVMREDWRKGLELVKEILTRPAFDPRVLGVVKNQALTELARQGEDAHTVSMREAAIWHFEGHPYGRDPLRALETIPAVTAEDCKDFLRSYFVPSNMVAAVSGDIDRSEAMRGLEDLFGALPQGRAPDRIMGDPSATPPVLVLIHKPGQVQSQVTMMLPGVKRTHPDYWKMSLMTSIFGGSDSLLYTRLRDDLGLVYAAYFYQTYKWRAGLLAGYIGCKGDMTARAIGETVEVMQALGDGISEARFTQKRLDVLNSFVFNVDSPEALAGVYAGYCLRDEPLDTLDRIQDTYLNVTGDEVRGLARRYLDPERLQIFVVGDKHITVAREDGTRVTLEEDLQALAQRLGIPYREMPLR